MTYLDKAKAFFNGTDSGLRGTRNLKDKIAGFEITQIEPNQIILEKEGKTFALEVGSSVKRRGDEAWALQEGAMGYSSLDSGPSNEPKLVSNSKEESVPGSTGVSDILKKLMEKRKKELK